MINRLVKRRNACAGVYRRVDLSFGGPLEGETGFRGRDGSSWAKVTDVGRRKRGHRPADFHHEGRSFKVEMIPVVAPHGVGWPIDQSK